MRSYGQLEEEDDDERRALLENNLGVQVNQSLCTAHCMHLHWPIKDDILPTKSTLIHAVSPDSLTENKVNIIPDKSASQHCRLLLHTPAFQLGTYDFL
jgi:hypothetical protein